MLEKTHRNSFVAGAPSIQTPLGELERIYIRFRRPPSYSWDSTAPDPAPGELAALPQTTLPVFPPEDLIFPYKLVDKHALRYTFVRFVQLA